MILKISEDYSETPGGRYIKEGKFSGEDFRNTHLIPKIKECQKSNEKLIIDLDGGYGYSTGFLEESFGGLIREGYRKEDLSILSFISNEEPDLINTILTYIEEENNRIHRKTMKKK